MEPWLFARTLWQFATLCPLQHAPDPSGARHVPPTRRFGT